MSLRARYSFLVLTFTTILIYFYGNISYQNPEYATWELHDYRAMAQASPGVSTGITQPFVYRILGPYLAGILPFSVDTNFRVLSIALALSLSLIFYFYLTSSELEPYVAALVTTLLVCNKYIFGFPVWNYYEVCDLLALNEIVLLMWLMPSRRWIAFGVILFAGALTKETVLLMIPAVGVYLFEKRIVAREWRAVLVAVVPAATAAFALRIMLAPSGGYNLVQAVMIYGDKFVLPETWFRLLINSFIPVAAVPLLYIGLTADYFGKRMHALIYFMLVILSTFWGYNNERLMAPAFIVFYPLIAVIISAGILNSPRMMSIVVFAAILSSLHHTMARFPVPRETSVPLSLAALFLVTIAIAYFRFRKPISAGAHG